ncbi:MAG: 4Fe-4S dicluster domain-containing protein [Anaerolineae bacterium]|jgi:NADH-quinone oxidoreductase subunit I|nr:4Fe-4S dicluster domain-containing protein [Anaerolineae bacterium]
MNGWEIIRGLGVTLGHFFDTYLEDIRWKGKRYRTKEGIEGRRNASVRGAFTIQYPEEKLPVWEEFRYLPFLVYDISAEGEREIRCTACGICSKVCPPQCIWITRKKDPETGRPITKPEVFAIDVDICMNCGFCAEFCPFDAIKMDHEYEIASRSRDGNIYQLEKLLKSKDYYHSIRPNNSSREEKEKLEKEAEKLKKSESTV